MRNLNSDSIGTLSSAMQQHCFMAYAIFGLSPINFMSIQSNASNQNERMTSISILAFFGSLCQLIRSIFCCPVQSAFGRRAGVISNIGPKTHLRAISLNVQCNYS